MFLNGSLVGGWATHLKNVLVKLEIFPKLGVKIRKIRNHHLENE